MIPQRRDVGIGVCVLAFVFLVLSSGFDRLSEQRPWFGRFVPDAIATHSLTRDAADTLAVQNAREARAAAMLAVVSDPLDARTLGFLGAAALRLKDNDKAHSAFRQADRLSRREPLSQIYFFDRELAIGSYRRAAERLDLFLRSVNGRETAQIMLSMFETRAGESTYLASRLASSPRWAQAYLQGTGKDTDRLRQRAGFLASADPALDRIGCAAVVPMIAELVRLNYRAEAEELVRRHCPSMVPAGTIADGAFEHFGDDGRPLGWRRYRSGDVRVSRLAGDKPRIEIENRSSVTRLVLSQPVELAPGTYTLRAKVDGPGGQHLAASLNCTTPSRPRVGRARLDREGQQLVAPQCSDAVLSLWLRPGSGRVVVDRVELEPVTP